MRFDVSYDIKIHSLLTLKDFCDRKSKFFKEIETKLLDAQIFTCKM